MIFTILTGIYVCAALLLTITVSGQTLLLLLYWQHRRDAAAVPPLDEWPTAAVQLPIYNEQHVIGRLLEAVAALDYPRDKLTVQVLDDSTDETSALVAEKVAALRADGLNIQHIRRDNRTGFKAGALAQGFAQLASEYVAVFDADFVPPPHFLKATIPHLAADPSLGMVQTRWGHLNASGNLLTRSQALALDGHFVVEQTARYRAGWLLSFNGSGGVWRSACIQAAGGWRDTTLTEDLDLSYRAQFAGWRFMYLPEVVVPGELPPQLAAYKQQQARWAQGNTQCLVRLIRPLWGGRFTLAQRVMATLHLAQYLPAPLLLLLLLLTPPLMLSGALDGLPLAPLGLAGLGPPLLYATSQWTLYPEWRRRMLAFPALLVLGTGISWNNTRAVLAAFLGRRMEFRRTPKFANTWQASGYALRGNPTLLGEIALAVYALCGAALAWRLNPMLIPYLTVYGVAFGALALWGLRDRWQIQG